MNSKIRFSNVVEEFKWREALFDATRGARRVLTNEKVTCYNGFDPSASSLHVGSLVPIMGLVRLQRHGHTPIALVGGGTGMIGDPSFRAEERKLMSVNQIDENAEAIRHQLEPFLDFKAKSNPARMVNNADWLRKTNLLDFLRDIGKHFTVNTMLNRESVKGRFDRNRGISFTEFSYQLLQAYDFLELYERYDCAFQAGGSDQWGNILGGVELIRRTHVTGLNKGPRPHGIAYPLVTSSNGEKFGKSIGNAPTLDPTQTSPFDFYQFFIRTPDADVIRYAKLMTLLEPAKISMMEESIREDAKSRYAQQQLAEHITRHVHGETGLRKAKTDTQIMFSPEARTLGNAQLVEDIRLLAPKYFATERRTLASLFVAQLSMFKSAGELVRLARGGGLYINDIKEVDPKRAVRLSDFKPEMGEQVMRVRQGKKKRWLLFLTDKQELTSLK